MSGRACSGFTAERGSTAADTSPSASTLAPSASTTATAPRWRPPVRAPRRTSTSSGLRICHVTCHSSGRNHLYSTLMPAASSFPAPAKPRSRRKMVVWSFLAIFLLPVFGAAGALAYRGGPTHWSQWDRNVVSALPAAAAYPQARILVMAGRTRGWKGALALHSWVVIKRQNDRAWRRYDVAGWGSPVRLNWWPPDLWFGERGEVVVDVRGAQAQALIPRIEAAIRDYRYANDGDYRIWPGPNSNTFVATVLRAVPELGAT